MLENFAADTGQGNGAALGQWLGEDFGEERGYFDRKLLQYAGWDATGPLFASIQIAWSFWMPLGEIRRSGIVWWLVWGS